MEEILKLLERRGDQAHQIAESLKHLPFEMAVHIILSYISIDEVGERLIPTICKEKEKPSHE